MMYFLEDEITPVLRGSESSGYMLTAENTDYAKSPEDLYLRS
jgi:hypothetical protein